MYMLYVAATLCLAVEVSMGSVARKLLFNLSLPQSSRRLACGDVLAHNQVYLATSAVPMTTSCTPSSTYNYIGRRSCSIQKCRCRMISTAPEDWLMVLYICKYTVL